MAKKTAKAQKNKNSRKALAPLEDRFEFLGAGGAPGQRTALRAAQFEVIDRQTGRERSLKLWHKTGTPVDEDLRQLWLHEMRQVQRVMSYAGASEVIVDIVEFVEDEKDFGVLLQNAGQPLSLKAKHVSSQHWLKTVGAPRARDLLWRNVKRVVGALGIIHAQGLVHGQLTADALMTEGSDEPDFQLTGFEWSLRLNADKSDRTHARLGSRGQTVRAKRYSFAEDWRALGRLVAGLLGATATPSGDIRAGSVYDVPIHLDRSEVSFLRRLVSPTRLDNLDAASISRSVDDIIATLGRTATTTTGTLILCFSQDCGLGGAIYDCTGGEIATDEYQSQLEWVRADIDNGARLLVPRVFDAGTGKLRLVSENLSMLLVPMRHQSAASWEVAMCVKIEQRSAALSIGDSEEHEIRQPIEIVASVRNAIETRSRLGPETLDWSAFTRASAPAAPADEATLVRQSLMMVQAIEAVIKALEIYPVKILRTDDHRRQIILRPEPANERDKFAKRVGLIDTARALKRLFEDDSRDGEGKWRLSQAASLGASRRDDVAASFVETLEHEGIRAYKFEIDDDLGDADKWFLRPERDAGTEGQITRRLRNIKSLIDRVDLVAMLNDPWRVRRSSRESIGDKERAGRHFQGLDRPKQNALADLWATLPSYFVVGPPGVGKTYLATEIIRRRFAADRASRLLLSAQAHDGLDHLQGELKKTLREEGLSDLILVRSTAADRPAGDEDVQQTGANLLRKLSESPLTQGAHRQISDRVHEMAAIAARPKALRQALAKDERIGLNAVASLVLDSADIVVSTANSPDIERLVEAREQFDWVIVEEAAKATGPELVGPMMLSGRRLLIGDHHQLPPFESERLGKVLSDHGRIVEALSLAEQYVGPLMRDGEIAELSALANDPKKLQATSDMALRLLEPFRTFVTEDERRRKSNTAHRSISGTLTEQRRMDPAIAHVVSQGFYGGNLRTLAKREKAAYEEGAPFDISGGLPPSPVVVVCFKHVSATGVAAPAESKKPRFHNPAEAEAVLDVLKLVRARKDAKERASLVVLSFYKAQVEKLSERIDAGVIGESLKHLTDFEMAAGTDWVSTVDGFQGKEADLVILSLVRNNPGTGASALGFLRDRRRMNVALSRAKSKLVIVGSLDFLKEAVTGVNPNPDNDEHDLSFLTRVNDAIRTLAVEKRPDGIPKAAVIDPSLLRPPVAPC